MKPNFALNITDSAISLLHRTSRGWLEVGSANFDAPDLEEALGYLRSSALGLSPHGITTKLVLPPGQVLYTEVDAPGPDKAARETQIRAALEGRTPYDVNDLVFDWWGTGPTVKVAVVARETLDEAEAFAEAHRFNPVSFVTTPAEGQFAGEPWFGVTRAAATLVPEGEKVTRDQDPVKIVTRDAPKPDASAAKVAEDTAKRDAEETARAETEAKAEAAAQKEAEAQKEAARQEAEAVAKAETAKREAEETARAAAEAEQKAAAKAEAEAAAAAAAKKAEADAKARAEADTAAAAEAEATRKTEAAKADLERRAQDLAQAEAKRLVEESEKIKSAQLEREKAKAALIEAERARAENAQLSFEGVTDPGIAETKESAPQEPAPAFSTRRRDESGAAPSVGPAAAKPAPAPAAPPAAPSKGPAAPTITSIAAHKPAAAPVKPPVVSPALSQTPERAPQDVAAKPAGTASAAPVVKQAVKPTVKPLNGTAAFATGAKAELAKPTMTADKGIVGKGVAAAMVTAASIPGTKTALSRFKSKVQSKAASANGKPAAIAASSGAGARNAGKDPSMGKFGAKLEQRRGKPRFLGLALVLILLAVMAGVAAWSSIYLSRDTGAPETIQTADAVPLVDAVPSDSQAITEAEAAADAEAELPPSQELAATDVPEADIVADEIAENAPPVVPDVGPEIASDETAQAAGPGRGPQDEIILAAIDDAQPAFDAVALPRPQSKPDNAPVAATPPPPFGTQYEFEPDGSIKATSTGVVMPEGFWLIAARPSKLPPARPAAISGPEVTTPAAPDANAAATPPPDAAAAEAAGASTAGISRMEGTGPSSAFVQDATVENRRPKTRPFTPEPAAAPGTNPASNPANPEDDATLAVEDPALARLAKLRPRVRPQAVVAAADQARKAAEAASLAAKAAAEEKTAQDSALTVALSPRPAARPRDFSGAVEAAIAAATRESARKVAVAPPADVVEPEAEEEPEVKVSAAPRIPTKANVAKQATFKSAINLSKTNLIGVYGSDNKRYALIRSSSGRYTKVKVGDRLDGGTVAAITRDEVRYKKGSKMLSLSMPKG